MVYANNLQAINALKDNVRTEIRNISPEMLDSDTANVNVRVATVIQRQGAWIEHMINYWNEFAKWCRTRKNLTTHRRLHVCKTGLWKNCKVFLSKQNATLSKTDAYFGPPCTIYVIYETRLWTDNQ